MHGTQNYLPGLLGPAIGEGSFNSTKTIYHLTRLAMESSTILVCFHSLRGKGAMCVYFLQCGVDKSCGEHFKQISSL